jgi:ABC-type glycerol-3-phosphate transport system permease component
MIQIRPTSQVIIWIFLLFLLLLSFIPVIMMIFMSFKDNAQIYGNFWGLPSPWKFGNYLAAFNAIKGYIKNSIIASTLALIGVLILSSMAGYVFARRWFPGKEIIFYAILSLMMIPGILTLIPSYVLVYQLGLVNTRWVLILPWISGGQVFGILLCRSFFSTLPQELFDSAQIDGANEFQLYSKIAVPLSYPIMVTLAIMNFNGTYNDFIWPLITISDTKLQVVTVGLRTFVSEYGITDMGPQLAAYGISALPLVIIFLFGMRYYIQGIIAGALKA